ncbi:hypothetical protein O3Q52_25150 [Streptomyces sp. ActVer]|uniref:hypothetical protein n=1 Tax=Streptomyces sp. ActVer TaxID=3014558 RepID=UPI0022B38B6A|nr:hypothetical protein [Streptomyces sp. ActVer]MCZ4511415.1 hypothetical protein [Streptomyces sp. ActVer]
MTMNGKTIVIVLSVVLATLMALAIAGFAFFATADGESSGSDHKVGGATPVAIVREGAVT